MKVKSNVNRRTTTGKGIVLRSSKASGKVITQPFGFAFKSWVMVFALDEIATVQVKN